MPWETSAVRRHQGPPSYCQNTLNSTSARTHSGTLLDWTSTDMLGYHQMTISLTIFPLPTLSFLHYYAMLPKFICPLLLTLNYFCFLKSFIRFKLNSSSSPDFPCIILHLYFLVKPGSSQRQFLPQPSWVVTCLPHTSPLPLHVRIHSFCSSEVYMCYPDHMARILPLGFW